MKVELNTNIVKSITPGVYWNGLEEAVREDCWDDFLKQYDEVTKEKLDNLLVYTDFCGAEINNIKRDKPREYNFGDDELIFTIDLPDNIIDIIKQNVDDEFFQWANKIYHSYDGFISFMPYRREDYFEALDGNGYKEADRDRAIAMYIGHQIDMNNDLAEAQRDLEDDAWEIICQNGYEYYGEDDDYE